MLGLETRRGRAAAQELAAAARGAAARRVRDEPRLSPSHLERTAFQLDLDRVGDAHEDGEAGIERHARPRSDALAAEERVRLRRQREPRALLAAAPSQLGCDLAPEARAVDGGQSLVEPDAEVPVPLAVDLEAGPLEEDGEV